MQWDRERLKYVKAILYGMLLHWPDKDLTLSDRKVLLALDNDDQMREITQGQEGGQR